MSRSSAVGQFSVEKQIISVTKHFSCAIFCGANSNANGHHRCSRQAWVSVHDPVAQPDRASAWGTGGRGFKSRRPDQIISLFSAT